MKLSVEWLKKYCPNSLDERQTAEALTRGGLEVEAIDKLSWGDCVLDAEVTSNRPDWLSHIGVARELAALTNSKLTFPEPRPNEVQPPAGAMTSVKVEDPVGCPRYTARIISAVTIGPSPEWMQRALAAVGLRPVNNIVDITNFVLFECGQPLHAFDFDKLAGRRIVVRRAAKGEKIVAIDGSGHELAATDLVIADERRPVAVAGVMGGLDTEISHATKNVLLESAFFDPLVVRDASRRLDLESDSSFRFSRRVDPMTVAWASARAAELIAELAGGKVHAGLIDVSAIKIERSEVAVRFERIKRVLGTAIEPERVRAILAALCFEMISEDAFSIRVRVPTFRTDVKGEIDVIEELARVYGYDHLQGKPGMKVRAGHRPKTLTGVERAAAVLSSCGYLEAVTYSFTTEEETCRFSPWQGDGVVKTRQSMKTNENVLRKTVIPSLLSAYALNRRRGNADVKLYEFSRVFLPRAGEKLPNEKVCVSLVDGESFRSAKGTLSALIERMRIPGVRSERAQMAVFEEGTALRYYANGQLLGVMGALEAREAEKFDLSERPTAAEFDFDLMLKLAPDAARYRAISAQPASRRDLAIVVDLDVDWAQIEKAVEEKKPANLESMEFFDEYRGKQVPEGTKSLAFSLTFREANRTLSSEEVDRSVQAILEALQQTVGAKLRS